MPGLRVTGGQLCGRRFKAPKVGVRPTSERVRESLFARLGDLSGQSVLDLYSGSGALAIEAASRGAASVVSLERASGSLAVLRGNIASLGLEDVVRVIPGDVAKSLRQLARAPERFDLALVDPPYGADEPTRAFEALAEAAVLVPGAMVVLERGRRHPSPRVRGFEDLDQRRYGDTVVARFIVGSPDMD